MKWNASLQKSSGGQSIIITLNQDGQALSFAQVIELWLEQSAFRIWYTDFLAALPYPAFYWEVAPINMHLLDRTFEFVVLNSKPLQNTIARRRAFEEHFDTKEAVVAFYNLGKDAQLIVPTPQNDAAAYAHLADFLRSPIPKQIDAFWQVLAQKYRDSIGEETTWLSTAGLGVAWLHARIDSRPKYYRHRPYRTLN